VLILSQKHRQRQREKILQANPASHVPRLSSTNNLAKGLIAISQTLYASATLYRAKGDQIKQYGFAAFGLTVSPYLIMSIVNLISTLLTPDYPTAYLVRSDAMVEASKREGAKFEGVVGSIRSQRTTSKSSGEIRFVDAADGRMSLELGPGIASARKIPSATLPTRFVMDHIRLPWSRDMIERPALMISSCSEFDVTGDERNEHRAWIGIGLASAGLTSISIAINGALSHFNPGHSTLAQRVWTMTWLVCGIILGPYAIAFEFTVLESGGCFSMGRHQ